jgi:NAD(P)-dependent dehydrogenase (short-subunit alcohol dehydrogenase family)
MELSGRTAIVTGGAQRIGRALVLALAGAGCDIVLHYNGSDAAAQQTAADARSLGAQVIVHQLDLSRVEAIDALTTIASRSLSPASILINNASGFAKDTLSDLSLESWTTTLQTSLRAPVFLTQAFARALPASGQGAVINITDWRVERPYKTHLSYTIAKAGLDAFTRAAALNLAPRIRVNAIALGAMLPPPDRDQAYLDAIAARLPLRRAGGAEVVAAAMLYLLSNDFVTGEIVRLDGGAHLV